MLPSLSNTPLRRDHHLGCGFVIPRQEGARIVADSQARQRVDPAPGPRRAIEYPIDIPEIRPPKFVSFETNSQH